MCIRDRGGLLATLQQRGKLFAASEQLITQRGFACQCAKAFAIGAEAGSLQQAAALGAMLLEQGKQGLFFIEQAVEARQIAFGECLEFVIDQLKHCLLYTSRCV